MAEFEIQRTCVLTIQGGGALGVELIGQLKGVTGGRRTLGGQSSDDLGFNVAGIAGTSAGAIIATLFWAGYEPRDILDIVATTFSAGTRERFFGPFDKREVRDFTTLETYLKNADRTLFGDWTPNRFPQVLPRARRALARLLLGIDVFVSKRWAFKKKGLLTAEGFTEEIDRLLKKSPKFHDDIGRTDKPLTFRDVRQLPQLGMVPLFLPITDVASQGLQVVSSIDDRWLDLPIAKAVRASAGFPIFFRPVELDDNHRCCIDGGLISNVPTWVFNQAYRERLRTASSIYDGEAELLAGLAALPWYHISLRLLPDKADGFPETGATYLKALWKLLSGVGRRHLEDTISAFVSVKRFIVEPKLAVAGSPERSPALESGASAESPAPISGVLDFSRLSDRRVLESLYHRGRETAHACIPVQRLVLPPQEAVLLVLEELIGKAEAALKPYLVANSRVRANIYLPASNDTMKIAYAYNMAGHADEGIAIAKGHAVTSMCYLYGEPFLANLRDKLLDAQIPEGLDPFRPIVQRDRTWLLSVPILDPLDTLPRRSDPNGALSMDAFGPRYGALNVDANVLYGGAGLDPIPIMQATHPAVRLVFDAMKAASREIGLLFNEPWLPGVSAS